ncbi:MAG: chemotaxis protein [Thaumarchaeota archaeon]|nr:chemotaxis protein [Nitrososphaerota archaeon]
MVEKTVKKKITKTVRKTKKITKREPSPSVLLKNVASFSNSNKALQKEIKVMSKIFGENQKVLISMKGMIDTLTSTLEHIQKQSKQINVIEEDTQKLYLGLNQVRIQSNLVSKINDQTSKLQVEINRISDFQKTSKSVSQQVKDSMDSIKNNSQMIIKIAQRIDEVRDDLREVSGKADSFLEIGSEISKLKNSIDEISGKTLGIETRTQIIESLKQELGKIVERTTFTSNLNAELEAIKITIDSISSKASKIDSLGGVIDGLKQQFDTIALKTNSVEGTSLESIKELEGKINGIEQKISTVSEFLKRQDASTTEFHKKSEKLFEEMQAVKNITSKVSSDSSKEMMALLKLSEYQSSIRMNSESKYGSAKDLEKMASQTSNIVNLFDRISIEVGEKIPLPYEVRQWAISKIFDCADKWEIRFSDVYSILTNAIGKDMFKEAVRIQQVRDIYGIRAVDEIRNDLNIS